MTALILGVAAIIWFGWGQAHPPAGWPALLAAGSIAALGVTAAAAVMARRLRGGASAMNDPRARRTYVRVVALEVAVMALGAAGLAVAGQSAYTPAWILLVVGIHFLPLARLFRTPGLSLAGLALTAIAIGAAAIGAMSSVQPSTVAGAGGGIVCLACAASCLYQAHRFDRTE